MTDEPLTPGHRWAITVAVMLVTVMQIIDTSVTNVVLPRLALRRGRGAQADKSFSMTIVSTHLPSS